MIILILSLFSTEKVYFSISINVKYISHVFNPLLSTVEPMLEDHPIGHKNIVSQDRWSLVTGSFTLKCPKLVALQDRWSLKTTGFTVFHMN